MNTLNGKTIKVKTRYGTRFTFQVVRNLRKDGKPTNEIVKGLGSLRSSRLNDTQAVLGFWLRVTTTLNQLLAENRISRADANKVKRKFEAVVPVKPLLSGVSKVRI
jgi:hypothetical protein